MQVTHERVKVPVGTATMSAYLARPTAPGGPTYPSWSRWKCPDTATQAPSRRAQLSV